MTNKTNNVGKKNLPTVYEVKSKDVTEVMTNIMKFTTQPRPTTEEEYVERFEWYFSYCRDNGVKPTVESFGLAMGWASSETLNKYERGVGGPFLADLVRRGKFVIQTFMSMMAMNGDINPTIWIFYTKNFFGMVDVKQVVVSGNDIGNYDQDKIDEIVEQLPQGDE